MNTFTSLFAEPTVDTTKTITRSESSSRGTFFSVTHAFATDNQNVYPYPGKGDAYVLLHDVLFVYFAKNGKVVLAPVACSKGFDKLMPWQLKDYLPAPLVCGGSRWRRPASPPYREQRPILSDGRSPINKSVSPWEM